MSTAEFLSSLREREVRLWVEDGRLKCDAPPGALDDALRAQLAARKPELLALISEAQTDVDAPRSLVPLKPSGDYPPLFVRPGHNGDVFCYLALAEHLDPRQPLYGIEPKGLTDGRPLETVEEMAAYEVGQIRSVQPEGPYHIAGYCAGGAIAFESAKQLTQAGEAVSRLMLLGSPFPTAYRAGWMQAQLHRARRHLPGLRSGSLADRIEYIRGRARARSAEEAKRRDPTLANRRRVEDATLAAVKRYTPGFYAGRLDLVLPSEAWRHSGDRADEWKRVAARVVEYVGPDESDGDRMLREPHAQGVAEMITRSLRDQGGAA